MAAKIVTVPTAVNILMDFLKYLLKLDKNIFIRFFQKQINFARNCQHQNVFKTEH